MRADMTPAHDVGPLPYFARKMTAELVRRAAPTNAVTYAPAPMSCATPRHSTRNPLDLADVFQLGLHFEPAVLGLADQPRHFRLP